MLPEISATIQAEDPRYPLLILESEEFGTVGYWLDISSGVLTRCCICDARSVGECVCGAWDVDDH